MLAPLAMNGKVALVTGAGGGLGSATARKLAEAGAKIVAVDVSAAALSDRAKEIRNAGGEIMEMPLDLSSRENCARAIEDTISEFGRIDALCNVAGMLKAGRSTEFAEEDWDVVMKVNLEAPFFLARAAIPHMIEKGGGIVNVCSTAAFKAQGFFSAYCASKAGLLHMTKAMAVEYIKSPIRINAVAPGGMETELATSVYWAASLDPDIFGRLGNPRGFCVIDDVADMVAYLASPAARSVHGACFTVDTGEIVY